MSMTRIIAPNKEYAGISAGVSFRGGEGCTDNPYLIGWFKAHGYEVIDQTTESKPAEKPKRRRKGA